MSIPGLGQIPVQAPASTKRTFKLAPLAEWRFVVSQPAIRLRLLSGTAERDGTELAANQPYTFAGTQSKILSWHGCELEVDGACDSESVSAPAATSDGSPPAVVSYLNLHLLLASERAAAAAVAASLPPGVSTRGPGGPRVLVCGGPSTGRSSLVRTLAAWATKTSSSGVSGGAGQATTSHQPCVVNVDPRDGLLSLPGTLSAAVFATLMDLETEGGGGWGGAPSSGPSAVPVKLPLVYGFGYARPADAPAFYRALVTCLAGAVAARIADDPAVHAGGLLMDAPAIRCLGEDDEGDSDEKEEGEDDDEPRQQRMQDDIEMLAHIIDEFSINRVVVLSRGGSGGSGSRNGVAQRNGSLKQPPPATEADVLAALTRRLARETTSYGEPVQVVQLDVSDGVVARTSLSQQQQHEACIREYFFGDAKRTLSPYTQQVDYDALTIYRLPDAGSDDSRLQKVEASASLMHWTLAVMNAAVHDAPDAVQYAAVLGFVYVTDVDPERRKMRILAPVSGRLGDRPFVFGRWPEPYINLVG